MTAPKELLERIRLRLDESFTGIGEVVSDLPPADIADLVNQLNLVEAATVILMLHTARAVEVCDHESNAERAAPTAASTSAAVPRGTRPMASSVDGE